MASGTGWRSVIPDVIDELELAAYELVEFVVTGVESNARAGAPIGPTGNLANSQTSETQRIPGGADGVARSGAEYSAYVNYGTGARGAASNVPGRGEEIRYSAGWQGMAARPYMSEAAEIAREEWEKGWRALEGRLPRL